MEVIVYSQPYCIYCINQKIFLKEKGIEFKEINIHESEAVYKEFIELGGTGTPYTIKKENGEITAKVKGFDTERLLHYLVE